MKEVNDMDSQKSAPNIHGAGKKKVAANAGGEPGPKGFTEAGYEFKIDFESPEERERILAEIAESTRRRFYPGFFS